MGDERGVHYLDCGDAFIGVVCVNIYQIVYFKCVQFIMSIIPQ